MNTIVIILFKSIGISQSIMIEKIEVISISPVMKVQVIGIRQLTASNQGRKHIQMDLTFTNTDRSEDNPAGLLLSTMNEKEVGDNVQDIR